MIKTKDVIVVSTLSERSSEGCVGRAMRALLYHNTSIVYLRERVPVHAS